MNDTSAQRMPALFIGHGSPMNTLEDNGFTNVWKRMGTVIGKPRGILVVSAHWFIGSTAVTAMANPRTIHDFYGFPQPLFDFQYPAPGLPELAAEVVGVAKPDWVGLDRDQWGLDHGTWSVLAHLFPDADVPVVQLSINALKPMDYHVELGAKLNALRDRGILLLSSGNVVHNLRRIDWHAGDSGEAWAQRFDDAAADVMIHRPGDIAALANHPDFAAAVPTPDHFVPLLYTAGIAAAAPSGAEVLLRGYSLGALSMTCYGVSCEAIGCRQGHDAATLPSNVPPDQTNI
jgi:4,5-DOPA dioxygenase extradiol